MHSIGRSSALFAILMGIFVLLGWIASIETLKHILPGLVAMNPVTAISFILAGLSLYLKTLPADSSSKIKALSLVFAGVIVCVGALKMAGAILRWEWNIDQLLFPVRLGNNRMAPNTAINFVLLGLALLWIDRETNRKSRPSEFLVLAATLISLMAIIGYVYGVRSFYGIASFIPMAVHTAITFVVLGVGLLWVRTNHGFMSIVTSPSSAGAMIRVFVPAAILIPAILGWLRLQGQMWGAYSHEFGAAIFTTLNILLFLVVVLWNGVKLHRADLQRQHAEVMLKELNNDLEKLVENRTRLLQVSNDDLFREIEDRKRAESKVTKLNQELDQRVNERTAELETANRELESFSYSVSHDLRAPLRHIDGFVELLRKNAGLSLDEKSLRYLHVISSSAKKMGILIDELLLFSRMGRTPVERTKVDLSELLRKVMVELAPDTQGRRIEWVINPLPQVPADPSLLRQVLMNLLSNAVKYSRTREYARIEVGFKEESMQYVFHVKDNGVGFDMNHAENLFGVFQRLHREEEFEGTGIGLANVRRIITRHGGNTWATAKLNEGATFYFSLPKEDSGS